MNIVLSMIFLFETCNLRLVTDAVAMEEDNAVAIHTQDHIRLGVSLLEMKVKQTVFTRYRKQHVDIPGQPPFMSLL